MMQKLLRVCVLLLLVAGQVRAEGPPPASSGATIGAIRIEGNERVEEEAIRVQLQSRPEDPLSPELVDRDIRAIYGMGFFKAVDASESEENGRPVLTFKVKERPLIREVRIEGNDALKKDALETALKGHPRTILNPVKIRRGIDEARKAYEQKGYLDVDITYRTEEVAPGEVVLTFTINERQKIHVKALLFEGNRAFATDDLRGVMSTRTKDILSRILVSRGVLDRDVLKTDIERLTAYYYDHGYINVRIDEPRVQRREDGLYVTVRIDEGDQFKVGEIGFSGDVPGGAEIARKGVALVPGEVFKASTLRDDVFRLTGYFSDFGFAFVNVEPETSVDPDKKLVSITFQVDKGPEVYIDRIEVSGNTKTRDKVIRRELRIDEQGLFNATDLQVSRERIQRLGFFEDVNVTTQRGARNDLLNVLVDVKEAQTGAFSVGAGFSSSANIVGSLQLQEENFLGRGQQASVGASIGTRYRNSYLNFTDPYVLDTNLTLGLELFNFEFAFEDFDRGGLGGSLRTFYPLTALGYESLWGFPLEDVRVGLQYKFERTRISNFDGVTPAAIRSERGTRTSGTLGPVLLRNTLNHPLDPTDGSFQQLSFTHAGVGGETNYEKLELDTRFFIPVYNSRRFGTLVWRTGGFLGYGLGDISFTKIDPISTRGKRILDGDLPVFDRYFPGGINSIRGFGERSLGPRERVAFGVDDEFSPNGSKIRIFRRPIGGSQMLIVNNELIFPIIQQLNLKGVVFSDIGNAFTRQQGLDVSDLRYSVGGGIRWRSPFAPIRIEIGRPLNAKSNERTSSIHFSLGGFGGVGTGGRGGGGGSPY